MPGYDEKTGQGLVRHLYVRTNAKGQSLICVVVNGERLPGEEALVEAMRQAVRSAVGVVLNVNTRKGNVVLGEKYRTLWGENFLMDTLCGLTFKLSVPSFYQVNRDQAEVLYCKAVEYAGLTGTELVLDLYCGAGTITLTMADRAKKVIGAEIVAPAVENARENAAANGIENVEFFCGDAGDIAARLAEERLRPEVICVDPPRKGLAPEVIDAMVQMGPERIVYVSCDPATLGRDVKLLAQRGYAARRAAAVDLFPGTAHVETVVQLVRKKPDTYIDITVDMDELDLTSSEAKATYDEIKDYIFDTHRVKVSSLYVAQVKQKHGIIERDCYNNSKKDNPKQPQCPPEKVKLIEEALRHFKMIP